MPATTRPNTPNVVQARKRPMVTDPPSSAAQRRHPHPACPGPTGTRHQGCPPSGMNDRTAPGRPARTTRAVIVEAPVMTSHKGKGADGTHPTKRHDRHLHGRPDMRILFV